MLFFWCCLASGGELQLKACALNSCSVVACRRQFRMWGGGECFCKKVLRQASKEQAATMVREYPVFYGTVSAGDAIYVPFGFVVSEYIGSQ